MTTPEESFRKIDPVYAFNLKKAEQQKKDQEKMEQLNERIQKAKQDFSSENSFEKETLEIRKQRGEKYGDVEAGHTNLGRAWASLLSEYLQVQVPDLPAHIVCLMLVQLKVSRASRPFAFDKDNFLDLKNYAQFAYETDPRNPLYKKSEVSKKKI